MALVRGTAGVLLHDQQYHQQCEEPAILLCYCTCHCHVHPHSEYRSAKQADSSSIHSNLVTLLPHMYLNYTNCEYGELLASLCVA